MTDSKNKPVKEIRDGFVKAIIWANQGKHGIRYSVDLVRSYKDKGDKWQSTSYLSNGEILKGQRLLGLAYAAILAFKAEEQSASG